MDNPFIAGAKKLIAEIASRGRRAPAKTPEPVQDHFREDAPPRGVQSQARVNGELWGMTRVVQCAGIACVLNAGIMFATTHIVSKRPIQEISTKGDLRAQIQAHFETSGINTDDLVLYLYSIFSLKFGVSPEGTPYVPLLQGLVDKEIYDSISTNLARNLDTVKTQGITQSLHISRIIDIEIDEANNRIGATIEGTLATHIEKTKRGVPLVMPSVPYRARVLIDLIPKSRLNPYGYFLLSPLKEFYGEENTQKFDKEMELNRERLSGKK